MRRYRISALLCSDPDHPKIPVGIVVSDTDHHALDEFWNRPQTCRYPFGIYCEDVGPAGFRGWLKSILLQLAAYL